MALVDIVIDTNILLHANNPGYPGQASCIEFLDNIQASTELLCLDEGFHTDEAKNRSLIGSEYLQKLRTPGTRGRLFVEAMFRSQRCKEVPVKVEQRVLKVINQSIRTEKARDKTFLRVAVNSVDKVFVSHDSEDFDKARRKFFDKTIGVRIIACTEY